jgi:DNA polymerase III subunit epsilon
VSRSEYIEIGVREQAIAWAHRMVTSPTVVFLDTETTGLGEDAEIVDIAVIDRNGRTLLDTLVRPEGALSAEVVNIHGITETDLIDAPRWPEVYPLLGRILDQHTPVVIYNAPFDSRIINQVNRRHGLPKFNADWQCAMQRFAEYAGIWHPKYENFRWHRLADALRMTNQPAPIRDHRALADAESCRNIVRAMAEQDRAPVVVPPSIDDESRREWGLGARTREFPGGRVTVITANQGCSRTMLIVVAVVLFLCVATACCALLVLSVRTL